MIDIRDRTRRPPALDLLLEAAQLPRHEHNWEGSFTGTRGSAAGGCELRVKASIGFANEMIEGRGRCVNYPADLPEADGHFTLSGTLDPSSAGFQIWFAGAPLGHVPLIAAGQLSTDGRELSGDWSIACFSPGTCDCEGGGGTYLLKRID